MNQHLLSIRMENCSEKLCGTNEFKHDHFAWEGKCWMQYFCYDQKYNYILLSIFFSCWCKASEGFTAIALYDSLHHVNVSESLCLFLPLYLSLSISASLSVVLHFSLSLLCYVGFTPSCHLYTRQIWHVHFRLESIFICLTYLAWVFYPKMSRGLFNKRMWSTLPCLVYCWHSKGG